MAEDSGVIFIMAGAFGVKSMAARDSGVRPWWPMILKDHHDEFRLVLFIVNNNKSQWEQNLVSPLDKQGPEILGCGPRVIVYLGVGSVMVSHSVTVETGK